MIDFVCYIQDLMSGKVWGTFCHRGIYYIHTFLCVHVVAPSYHLGNPSIKVRSVRSIDRKQWLLLPKDFDSKQLNEDENE